MIVGKKITQLTGMKMARIALVHVGISFKLYLWVPVSTMNTGK